MNNTISGGIYRRDASIIPDSIQKDKRIITFCWSTGSRVLRVPWFEDPFYEELSLDKQHVRLHRLNNHAPFLKMHRSNELADSIGVHQRAWIEGDKGFAEVRFSKRKDVDEIWGEVCDGILRNISVGYKTYQIRETKNKGDFPIRMATDWEPHENSLVLVGADADAQIRSESKTILYPIQITRSNDMADKEINNKSRKTADLKNTPPASASPDNSINTISQEKMAQIRSEELKRISEINSLCEQHEIPANIRNSLVNDGATLDTARLRILDHLTKENEKSRINPYQKTRIESGSYDQREIFKEGFENAILHRISPERHSLDDKGRMFIGSSLYDLAKDEQELRGEKIKGVSKSDILTRSFLSTSDFPLMLSNIANKELLASYQEQMKGQTFRPLVQEKMFDNFKPKTSVRYGEMPDLKEIHEGEEITFDSLGESGEQWTIGSFARGTQITRKAIINNDLDSFSILYNWTKSILRLESRIVWGLFKNHLMSDKHSLFDRKNHNNEAAKGTELGVKSLASAIYEMSLQKGIDQRPDDYLDIAPSYLIVPSILDQHARKLIYEPFNPTDMESTNPYRGKFQVISEPRLNVGPDQNVPWYLSAKPSDFPIIYVGYLAGERNPTIDWEINKRNRGLSIYCFYDFGATVADYRGLYKNNGVKVEL